MRDRDVRHALLSKVFAEHIRDPNTLVIQELGLAYGQARVDVAVVNGRMHAFEIKSDADTLQRLPSQIEAYSAVFDRVTIVVGSKHADAAAAMIPNWWGIKIATSGIRGAVHFEHFRHPRQNVEISKYDLASLLWREEAIKLLESLGVKSIKSKNRSTLCSLIAETVVLDDLRGYVRQVLKTRVDWRSDMQRVPCAD